MKKSKWISAGVMALTMLSTTGTVFAATTKQQTAQPNLNYVVFCQDNLSPTTTTGGTESIDWIVDQLPVGTDHFATVADIEAIGKGSHTLKMIVSSAQGKRLATSVEKFTCGANSTESVTTKWNVDVGSGYNSVKYYLDKKYLGKGLIWGA